MPPRRPPRSSRSPSGSSSCSCPGSCALWACRGRHRRTRRGTLPSVRISAKSDYAVRAMAELATAGDKHAVKAEDIAVAQDIPLNFLLGILRELRNGQLVRSVRGREGGYLLSRSAADITLADIIRV